MAGESRDGARDEVGRCRPHQTSPGESLPPSPALLSLQLTDEDAIQAECLPLAYPASFYTLLLTKPASLCVVASTPAAPSVPLGCASGHVLPYTQCPLSSTDDDDDDDDERSARTTELPMIYLTSLAVDPIARNQGLGRQLVNELVHGLLASPSASSLAGRPRQRAVVQLHVEATNEAAIRLYKRLGLSETRRIRGYYKGLRGSGDAIEMKGVLFV